MDDKTTSALDLSPVRVETPAWEGRLARPGTAGPACQRRSNRDCLITRALEARLGRVWCREYPAATRPDQGRQATQATSAHEDVGLRGCDWLRAAGDRPWHRAGDEPAVV